MDVWEGWPVCAAGRAREGEGWGRREWEWEYEKQERERGNRLASAIKGVLFTPGVGSLKGDGKHSFLKPHASRTMVLPPDSL